MADIMRMGKNPNYLGSWDLDDLPNREVTLTIDRIVDEKAVANGQEQVVTACYWTDTAFKPMILNVTNKKTICKLYKTKETEKLRGKSVVVGIDKVKAFGDIYDALRIRARMPQAQTAVKPKCAECGKEINASGSMSPEQVAAYTEKKYGKRLCGECATAIAQGVKQ